jgi:hypothetical protein
LGDFIIDGGSTIDLERFVNNLTDGKKFKFVTLDNPEVDDPFDSDNGIIKVEFRRAKHNKLRLTQPDISSSWSMKTWPTQAELVDNSDVIWHYTNDLKSNNTLSDVTTVSYNCSTEFCSGATIEGSKSGQSFVYSNIEVEDTPVVLKLKLIGITNSRKKNYTYCIECGSKLKHKSKYCSECGKKV